VWLLMIDRFQCVNKCGLVCLLVCAVKNFFGGWTWLILFVFSAWFLFLVALWVVFGFGLRALSMLLKVTFNVAKSDV